MVQTREGLLGCPAPVGRREHRARAVGEQAPEIHVPAFTDPPEAPPLPTRVLARRQAEPAGKLARAPECVDVPDGADEGRGGQQPNPGNRPQSRHDGVGVGQGAQFPFQAGNPSLNRPHFLVDAREHLPQMPRQHGGRLVTQHR